MTDAIGGTSRPVRAVVAVIGGWVVARTAMLWPAAAVVDTATAGKTVVLPGISQPLIPANIWDRATSSGAGDAHLTGLVRSPSLARGHAIEIALDDEAPAVAIAAMLRARAGRGEDIALQPRAGPDALPSPSPSISRKLSGSVWALSRSAGGGAGLANGGQLGGSQAGLRVFYTPGPRALAVTGRISAPLGSSRGREASVGIALRGKNVGVIVEQRFALDKGGTDAPSLTVYGGVSEVPIVAGLRLDGYAQAGVVGLKRPAGFIDGAVRLERTILEDGASRLSGGVALSGGAQPGLSRLDVGPQLVARLPVAGTAVRVTAEWRQRIAGNAAPGSGPAVTVGFDF